MSRSGDGGKPGTAGDLRGKSVEELKEILERQEKLLNNPKFIVKLPDRGKKIKNYTEKVRAAIAEHERIQKTTDLLSKFKLEFEEKQNEVKEKSQSAWAIDKKTLELPAEKLQNKNSNSTGNESKEKGKSHTDAAATSSEGCNSNMGAENPSLVVENSCKTDDTFYKDTSSPSISNDKFHEQEYNVSPFIKDTVSPKKNAHTHGPLVQKHINPKTIGNNDDEANALVDSLKMISIKDGKEKGGYASETSKQSKNPPNPLLQQSHFFKVVEKRERSPVHRKEKFKTNRLLSDSNSSSPNQSPGERALRLSAQERRAQDRKHLDDITAARLPPLHHSPTLLLPVEESLTLQMDQKKSYEEIQAKLAAQKLFEKLNIKVGPFNPEGDSYMKYRDQKDDEGYDANG